MRTAFFCLFLLLLPSLTLANNGGLDAYGCVYDLEDGVYHCRRGELAGRSFNSQAEMRQAIIVRQAARQGQDKKLEGVPQPGKERKQLGR